jgi:hypothetical protein
MSKMHIHSSHTKEHVWSNGIVTWYVQQLQTGYGLVNEFMDHLHNLELQAITAPLLISTIHKSPQHPLSFSSLLCLHQPFPGIGF